MTNDNTRRLGGTAIAGMMLLAGLVTLVAVAAPVNAHDCEGETREDCGGGCGSGEHDHEWDSPSPGDCRSNCYLTDPLCYLGGSLVTYPVRVTRLLGGCNAESSFNHYDGALYNMRGFGGRTLTASASPGYSANLYYMRSVGTGCVTLGMTAIEGPQVYGEIPYDADMLFVESVSGSGRYDINIYNNGPAA